MSNSVAFATKLFCDFASYNRDIYAYDLITHQQIYSPLIRQTRWHLLSTVTMQCGLILAMEIPIYHGQYQLHLPVAAFTASSVSGKAPLTVKFTDKSTDAYYWSWNFGDKSTSKLQNHVHKYTNFENLSLNIATRIKVIFNEVKLESFKLSKDLRVLLWNCIQIS